MYKSTGKRHDKRAKSDMDQYVLDLSRVTRVTKGGKHLSFRACVLLGDRHGKVGMGLAKGRDVQIGVEKAANQAKKHLIKVPIVNETIPHMVGYKYKASRVLLKPAPKGSGIIAGGAARAVLEMAGIPNVSAKILGKTKNKITTAKAVFQALQLFKENSLPKKSEDRVDGENKVTA